MAFLIRESAEEKHKNVVKTRILHASVLQSIFRILTNIHTPRSTLRNSFLFLEEYKKMIFCKEKKLHHFFVTAIYIYIVI